MDLPRNVGGRDRILRGVLGVWLVVVAVAAYSEDRRLSAAVAGLSGAGLLQNAATGFCGGNFLFGIDTTDDACALD
ncbi:YgaP family membrane protein [Halogeometricum limi]|uniref:Inner membrane protein YgaP-like transmembrane domain-containing protein n=1 Tax=Halogeometricum limi TaxID=555875 RepID=A0A1I6HWB5_9EURY|nr:DUF2892 domain-containing protein [Halogeometricum limi]SFR58717.1 Protein of unknown function [Halogeometricum limi]